MLLLVLHLVVAVAVPEKLFPMLELGLMVRCLLHIPFLPTIVLPQLLLYPLQYKIFARVMHQAS